MSDDREFLPQTQEHQPGLQHEMNPPPVIGENYKAAGKLKGKKLLITGGDSGIGRSVVVMAAMEGVDGITILYKEKEEKDAQETQIKLENTVPKWFLKPVTLRTPTSAKV